MLVSETIRAGIVSTLVAAATSAGASVHNSRSIPWGPGTSLPALAVSTDATNYTFSKLNCRLGDVEEQVTIAGAVDGDDSPDDLDQLARETVRALFADATWSGQFQAVSERLEIVKGIATNPQGNRRRASFELRFSVTYSESLTATATDSLTRVDVTQDRDTTNPDTPDVTQQMDLEGA